MTRINIDPLTEAELIDLNHRYGSGALLSDREQADRSANPAIDALTV